MTVGLRTRPGDFAVGDESMPQGLKAGIRLGLNVRAKALTYQP
jgi:hypothetical protein